MWERERGGSYDFLGGGASSLSTTRVGRKGLYYAQCVPGAAYVYQDISLCPKYLVSTFFFSAEIFTKKRPLPLSLSLLFFFFFFIRWEARQGAHSSSPTCSRPASTRPWPKHNSRTRYIVHVEEKKGKKKKKKERERDDYYPTVAGLYKRREKGLFKSSIRSLLETFSSFFSFHSTCILRPSTGLNAFGSTSKWERARIWANELHGEKKIKLYLGDVRRLHHQQKTWFDRFLLRRLVVWMQCKNSNYT